MNAHGRNTARRDIRDDDVCLGPGGRDRR